MPGFFWNRKWIDMERNAKHFPEEYPLCLDNIQHVLLQERQRRCHQLRLEHLECVVRALHLQPLQRLADEKPIVRTCGDGNAFALWRSCPDDASTVDCFPLLLIGRLQLGFWMIWGVVVQALVEMMMVSDDGWHGCIAAEVVSSKAHAAAARTPAVAFLVGFLTGRTDSQGGESRLTCGCRGWLQQRQAHSCCCW